MTFLDAAVLCQSVWLSDVIKKASVVNMEYDTSQWFCFLLPKIPLTSLRSEELKFKLPSICVFFCKNIDLKPNEATHENNYSHVFDFLKST